MKRNDYMKKINAKIDKSKRKLYRFHKRKLLPMLRKYNIIKHEIDITTNEIKTTIALLSFPLIIGIYVIVLQTHNAYDKYEQSQYIGKCRIKIHSVDKYNDKTYYCQMYNKKNELTNEMIYFHEDDSARIRENPYIGRVVRLYKNDMFK